MPLNQISVDLGSSIRFWDQVCPKLYERQNFEKIIIKVVINIQKCTLVQNFNQFGKLQILGLNLSKNMNDTNFEKINIKFETRI